MEVAKKSGCENSMLIHSKSEIPYDKIKNSNTIGISSGASAPEILIEDIRNKFSELYNTNEIQNHSIQENVYFKLPKSLDK